MYRGYNSTHKMFIFLNKLIHSDKMTVWHMIHKYPMQAIGH